MFRPQLLDPCRDLRQHLTRSFPSFWQVSSDGQPLTTWTPSDESKGLVRCSVPANTPFSVGCVATPYIASHQQADSTVAEQAACRLKIWCKSRHFLALSARA